MIDRAEAHATMDRFFDMLEQHGSVVATVALTQGAFGIESASFDGSDMTFHGYRVQVSCTFRKPQLPRFFDRILNPS